MEEKEAKKPYSLILYQEIHEGLAELYRPTLGLLVSSFSAGLDLGFSLLLMGVVYTMFDGVLSNGAVDFLVANMYSVGFIFVVLGRSELFTEHTTMAVLPILDKKAPVSRLIRLWVLVFAGNMVGAFFFALLATYIGPELGIIDIGVFGLIANSLVEHSWQVILISAVLAGWLMGLLSWLLTAAKETISQIFLVWIITTSIGLAKLHHSVVGTIEVLGGLFAGQGITSGDFGHFLFWAVIGNIIGGSVFVAGVKYSHVKQPGKRPDQRDSGK